MNQSLLSVELAQTHRRDLEDRAVTYRVVAAVRSVRAVRAPRSAARARRVQARLTRWVRAVATA